MFSKSKRFPEGGKDYIPGPGEYEVAGDEFSRHKRYGFFNQASRFGDSNDTSMNAEFYLSHDGLHSFPSSISTDTKISSTSSNRTAEDSKSYRRGDSNNNNNNQHFEKYRFAMQKEIEALQVKGRKLESTIQSMEEEKNDTKYVLLTKEQELADLRAKNATLQKTIARQEKASKATQLQKKVELLEDSMRNAEMKYQATLTEKDQTINTLREEAEQNKLNIVSLEKMQENQRIEYESLEDNFNRVSAELIESKNDAYQKQIQINQLHNDIENMLEKEALLVEQHQQIESQYQQQLDSKQAEIKQLNECNHQLMTDLENRSETIRKLESRVQSKDLEIGQLGKQIEKKANIIRTKDMLIDHLQTQFKTYRQYMDTILKDVRSNQQTKRVALYDELNRLLSELNEAKKFINIQALYLNSLKSDVYWLTLRNEQLWSLLSDLDNDFVSRWKYFDEVNAFPLLEIAILEPEPNMKDDISDSVSSSSRSSLSNQELITRNDTVPFVVMNDSGFSMITDIK